MAQVNIVPNWNFEGPDEFGVLTPPCANGINDIYYAYPWHGAYFTAFSNIIDGPMLNDTRPSIVNGYDYCSSNSNGVPYGPTAPENPFGYQIPRSGLRYITLAAGSFEHHYAKVPLIEPIYYGDEIDLSLFVSQGDNVEALGFEVVISTDGSWSNDDITIYEGVADNKIDWVEHTSHTIVSDPSNDLDEHGCGPWNYLLIGTNYNVNTSALYLDDVSLVKTFDCMVENSCLPRTGPVDLTFVYPHADEHPFCILGCDNLTWIRMEIYTTGGQYLQFYFEMDYPPDRVCWDGRTVFGAEVATGTYEYRIKARSHCVCSKEYTDNFLKMGDSETEDPDFYYLLEAESCQIPSYCCGSESTSWSIVDCSINSSEEYDVRNQIIVSNSIIEDGHSLHLKAGNRIELTDFNSGDNTSFIAEIIPCPTLSGRYGYNQDSPNRDDLSYESPRSYPVHPSSPLNNSIIPNPTTGLITYNATAPLTSASIMDLTGRALHTANLSGVEGPVNIDLSPYRPGTYLLRIQYQSGKTEVHRVVRQ